MRQFPLSLQKLDRPDKVALYGQSTLDLSSRAVRDCTNRSRSPDFVIFGICKSASTWLHMALQKHPQIYMPVPETPCFEDPYYREDNLSMLYDALAPAPETAVLGIRRSDYLGIPGCAARMAKHIPNAKLIAMLRNPVERAVSNYLHLVRRGRISADSLEVAFSRYLEGQFDPPYIRRSILEYGNYATALESYLQHFASEQILLLTDDDLHRSPAATFAKACRFLGVCDDYVPPLLNIRRNRGIHSKHLISIANRLSTLLYEYDPRTGWARQKRGSAANFARWALPIFNRVSSFSSLAGLQKPISLPGHTRQRLLEYYLPEIKRLEQISSLNLDLWKC